MMKNTPFLELLAEQLYRQYGRELSDVVVVFPNRRAGLFFRQFLGQKTTEEIWSPGIQGISDFVKQMSSLLAADPIDLIFDLYRDYSRLVKFPESLDEFWFWGEMMLSDFDEIDKYLVDADSLFTNIKELKEIEDQFGDLEPEQVEFIRRFWSNFHTGSNSDVKSGFSVIWELLPVLYKKFKESLREKETAYEGMIYRDVAENMLDIGLNKLKWKKIIFAGFNALNACEKRIFSILKNSGRADFFWDFDRAYLSDRNFEAGRFMRENLELFPPPVALEEFNNYAAEKEIRIFDLPGDIMQTRVMHDIIVEDDKREYHFNDSAIVLCDENLLLPVLSSVPGEVEEINVTMGYPLQSTPVFGLADTLLTLQANTREQKDGNIRFYYRDVESVLNHQYIRLLAPESCADLKARIIEGNMIYIPRSEFKGKLEQLIFRKVTGHEDFYDYFSLLFSHISGRLEEEGTSMQASMEKEYIHILTARLNKLSAVLKDREEISLEIFTRLFRKLLRSQRIPFTGEPLAGLQVMGILETRLLDFSHIIMLSVNEELMPKPHRAQSFIPWALRYAYQMPSREELDAIYAYYFHRLIQRAEKIDLLFNSASEGMKSGEMSRYLYQLKFNRNIDIIHPVLNLVSIEQNEIVVKKDENVQNRLKMYFVGENAFSERYLSPSALNSYIDCPLKFYFRYIAGVGEEEEVLEEVDNIYFGTLLHESMARLYQGIINPDGELSAEDLKRLLDGDEPERMLIEVFREFFFKGRAGAVPEGKNIIIFRVILKYIRKIISTDLHLAPVKGFISEQEFTRDVFLSSGDKNLRIRIGGKIDRIDYVNGQLRVLDYKTGAAKMDIFSLSHLFDGENKNRNRAGFQTLLYAWMVNKEGVMPGLYVVRDLFKENFSPSFFLGSNKEKKVLQSYGEVSEEYELALTALLAELINVELPFTQTRQKEHCKLCDYNKICRR